MRQSINKVNDIRSTPSQIGSILDILNSVKDNNLILQSNDTTLLHEPAKFPPHSVSNLLTKVVSEVVPSEIPAIVFDGTIERIRQTFSGTVLDIREQEFDARIEDKTNPENPDEIVTLSIEDIEPHELPMLKPGAMFSWYIGYHEGQKVPRRRISAIKFVRLPKWTNKEINIAKERAKEYDNFFNKNINTGV
jgi:hypothetical protein